MPGAQVPFYLDWTFWSFAVATIAILLSQLPPLRDLLGKPVLLLEHSGAIQLHHMVGYPNAGIYISLRNVGRRPARIKALTLSFARERSAPFELDAAQYFVAPTDTRPVLITPFTLQAAEEWGHIALFIRPLDRQEDRRLGELRAALRTDIADKVRAAQARNEQVNGLHEADEETLTPLIDLFNRNFAWAPGEYQLEVRAHTEEVGVVRANARFTLFESDADELASYVEDYKFGFGPAIDHERHKGVFPRLRAAGS